ncbi:Crp/Fnr family transcriptional regulator [Mucilaginibacter sabulilitoris]|uniref:Crp/Fnr family transcriptional regulator n=1 Tax=Mucilaginibacter sabulilitoris TaxID=1173583 RepID=A0ABZ0TG26_9SPHI|nr:Crp/Fnr family transcriptional regulator [Mucilaginibacter sabulilitoris]WPU92141.1 Crp/Fnr family transcriptional regulator [Mucilaginibacter sabulilitoris]
MMITNLTDHIKKFVELNDADIELVNSAVTIKSVKKKAFLLEPDHTCKEIYFVSKGCLRLYFINKKLNEQITQFAIENWWMSDYSSLESETPSNYYIQAVEHSEIISINKNKLEDLFEKIPRLERYFRIVQQRAFIAAQRRIEYIYTFNDEERYRNFSDRFPGFIQRIPQYMLASYLGFTPQFMSKIRAKKI